MSSSTTAPDSRDILGNARFSSFSGSSQTYNDAPTASSILGATSTVDPAALHPLAGLIDNKDLDYLSLDDDKISGVEGGKSVLPSRGWSDELCYGTGSTYLCGLAAGGLWGLSEGMRRPLGPTKASTPIGSINPATAASAATTTSTPPPASSIGAQATAFAKEAASSSAAKGSTVPPQSAAAASSNRISRRLRWNHILNQVTRRGSFTGNSAGVLALIYNGFNSTLDSYRGGKHDVYGSMAAGAMTGALWRCTAGPKRMVVTSGLLTVGAAAWTGFKYQFL